MLVTDSTPSSYSLAPSAALLLPCALPSLPAVSPAPPTGPETTPPCAWSAPLSALLSLAPLSALLLLRLCFERDRRDRVTVCGPARLNTCVACATPVYVAISSAATSVAVVAGATLMVHRAASSVSSALAASAPPRIA